MSRIALPKSDYQVMESNLRNFLKPKSIDRVFGLEETALGLCAALILRYFDECGFKIEKGARTSIAELQGLLRVESRYVRMLHFFLSVLQGQGIVSLNDGTACFLKDVSEVPPETQFIKKIRDVFPQFIQFFSFVDHCARHYRHVLTGAMPGLQVIFPNGDSSALEKIYKNTPQIGHEFFCLNLAREVLTDRIDGLEAQGISPSIIEIGAGQGILTDILLPAVGHRVDKYMFTDIGQAFVNQGKHKYASKAGKWMEFGVLDASRDPLEQGLSYASYDALVGFNILHATPNVAYTLREVGKLVKPDGMMLFVENVKQQPWIDMIYGLTDGWWLFDDGIREISPLLTIPQWEAVLAQAGFTQTMIFPSDRDLKQKTDTALIVIQKS